MGDGLRSVKEGDFLGVTNKECSDFAVYKVTHYELKGDKGTPRFLVVMKRCGTKTGNGKELQEREFPTIVGGIYHPYGTYIEAVYGYGAAQEFRISNFEIDSKVLETVGFTSTSIDLTKGLHTCGTSSTEEVIVSSHIDRKKFPNWWLVAG